MGAKTKVNKESIEQRLERMEKENQELKAQLAEKDQKLAEAEKKGKPETALERIRGFQSARATATAEAVIFNPLRKTAEIEKELTDQGYKPRSGYVACVRATIAVLLREDFLDSTVVNHYSGQ